MGEISSEERGETGFELPLHQIVIVKSIWRKDPRYTVLEEQQIFDKVKKKVEKVNKELGGRTDVPDDELEKITREVINGPSADKKEPSIEEEVGSALEGIVKENPELPPPPAEESPGREATAGPAEMQKPADQEVKDYNWISVEELTSQLKEMGVEKLEPILEEIKAQAAIKRVGEQINHSTKEVNEVLQKMIGKVLPSEYSSGLEKAVQAAQKIEGIVKAEKEIPARQKEPELKKTLVPREEVVKYLSDTFDRKVVEMMLKRFDENPDKCKGGELYNFEIVQAIAAKQQEKGREFTRGLEKRIPTKQEESKRIRETPLTRDEVITHLSKTVGNETVQIVLEELDKDPGAFTEDGKYRPGAVQALVKNRFKGKGIDFTKAKTIPAPTKQKPLEETVSETQAAVPVGKGELYKGPTEQGRQMLGKRIQNYVKEKATKLEQQIELTADEVTYFVEEASQKYFILGGGFDFPKVDMMMDEWLGKRVAKKPIPKAIEERLEIRLRKAIQERNMSDEDELALKGVLLEEAKKRDDFFSTQAIELAVVKRYEDKKKDQLKIEAEEAKMQESKVQSQPEVHEPEARRSSPVGYIVGVLSGVLISVFISYLLTGRGNVGNVDYSAVERAAKKAAAEAENTLAARLAGTKKEQEEKDNAQNAALDDTKKGVAGYGSAQEALAKKTNDVERGVADLTGKIEQLTLSYKEKDAGRDKQLAGIADAQASAEKKAEDMKKNIGQLAQAQKQADENAKTNYDKQEKQLELFAKSEAEHYGGTNKKIDDVADNLKKFEEGFAAYLKKEQEKKKEEKKETLIGPPEPEKKKEITPISPEQKKEKKIAVQKEIVKPTEILVRRTDILYGWLTGERTIGSCTATGAALLQESAQQLQFNLAYGTETVQLAAGVDASLGKLVHDVKGNNDLTNYTLGGRLFERLGKMAMSIEGDYLIHTINQDGSIPADGLMFSKLGKRMEGYRVKVDIEGIRIYNLILGIGGFYEEANGGIDARTTIGGTEVKSRLDSLVRKWGGSAKIRTVYFSDEDGINFKLIYNQETIREEDIKNIQSEFGGGVELEATLWKNAKLYIGADVVHAKREVKGAAIEAKDGVDFRSFIGVRIGGL